jgi:hypothetical protein
MRDRQGPEDPGFSGPKKCPVILKYHFLCLFKSEIQKYLLSFYFLVPRDAVKHFRQVFLNISQDSAAKLLLSGPWPPYNLN